MAILQVPPGSPLWVSIAAETILVMHIAGGGLGIVSGCAALFVRKGEWLHRAAGSVFLISMLCMSIVGAAASPFLPEPHLTDTVAGTMAFYMVTTAWATVRRKEGTVGQFEKVMLAVALGVMAMGAIMLWLASRSPTGTFEHQPIQAVYVFMVAGAFGAAGDINMIRRGGLTGSARIARHLWRMCFALFIAAGAFFLGQQRIMPVWMQGSPLLFIPALAPFGFLVFWLIRVRLTKWWRDDGAVPIPATN